MSSRWHLPTCHTPEIQVRGSAPFCEACGTEPDVPTLIAAKRNDSPFPPCPVDELPGEFNFSWPPTVLYSNSRRDHVATTSFHPNRVTRSTLETLQARRRTQRPDIAENATNIYPTRLKPDRLRFIILPASIDHTRPLHIDLEVHQDGLCPEYETVSYSWGGEDGDASSSYPIFVGRYWDVLLLTKNCWDMIRFLRPWRGVRTLWVDAICINQDDVQERETQVAKMAQIYRECRQTIVYLGPEMVQQALPGQYPLRRHLEDGIHGIDFLSLLRRRYFSRVWIIQELILPHQIVIPIGSMEISADKRSGWSLSGEASWGSTAAPWIAQIGQGALRPDEANIYDILRLTCHSESGDPRDKVFGAHALIQNSEADRWALGPDYSLSRLQVFFGVFAHSLINLKRTELLCNAAGVAARDGYPSWTPDLASPGKMESWFLKRPLEWKPEYPRPWDQLEGFNPAENKWWTGVAFETWRMYATEDADKKWRAPEALEDWGRHGDIPWSGPESHILHVSAEARRQRTTFEMEQDLDLRGVNRIHPTEFSTPTSPHQARVRAHLRWDLDPSVDSLTGSISLRLIHLLRFEATPEEVGMSLGAKIFRLRASAGGVNMYLTTDDFPLDQHVQPGLDHLFIMDRGEELPPLYLVMRRRSKQARWLSEFSLVACCYHLCFGVESRTWTTHETWTRAKVLECYSRWDDTLSLGISKETWEETRKDEDVFLSDLRPSLYDKIASVSGRMMAALRYPNFAGRNNRVAPSEKTEEIKLWERQSEIHRLLFLTEEVEETTPMLPAFQGLLNEQRGSSPGFLGSYAACLDPRFQPVAHGSHVELRVPPEEWEDVFPIAKQHYQEWRYDESSKWSQSRLVKYSLFRRNKPIHIRAHERDLKRAAMESVVYEQLLRLTSAAVREGQNEVTMVERYRAGFQRVQGSEPGYWGDESPTASRDQEEEEGDPRQTDPVWPEYIMKGFGIDGYTHRVTIF